MTIPQCPSCNQGVEFERSEWVACAGCLARHHASCWSEKRCCGRCADPRPLALQALPRKKRSFLPVLGMLAVVGGQGAAALWIAAQVEQATRRGVAEAAAQAAAEAKERQDALGACLERHEKSERLLAKIILQQDRTDRTDEILTKIDSLDPDESSRYRRLDRKIDSLGEQLAALSRAERQTIVVAAQKTGRSQAIESLAESRSNRTLTSSEYDKAKGAVLEGRMSPDSAIELANLGRLRRERMLSEGEFETAKKAILDPR